jgi:predicted DNA-binding transcriptional regulator YafY
MTRRFERLLEIDHCIRSRIKTTAPALAKQLECSVRTVGYDLEFLRDRFHAPLKFSPHEGWQYTDPEWRLPAVQISQGELFALTLGARMMEAYTGSAYQAELQGAIARLADRLPEQTWVNLQQLAQEKVLLRPGAEVSLDPYIWQELERACQNKTQVKIRYFTAGRVQESWRVVDPYILHVSRNNPYVTGFCHNRQMVRDFRIDRIREFKALKRKFKVLSEFDANQYFAEVFQHERGGEPQQIKVWFDAQTAPYIRERQWSAGQDIEEQADGSMMLQFEARGLNEVKRWILFYGKGAIALEPPELVQMIQDEISTMYGHYREERS